MPPRKSQETANTQEPAESRTYLSKTIAEADKKIEVVDTVPDMVWVKVRNTLDPGYPIGPFFYEDMKKGIPRQSFTFVHDNVHKERIPRAVFDAINDAKRPIKKNIETDFGLRSVDNGYEYLYQAIEVKQPA